MDDTKAAVQLLTDRAALHDLMARYSRGVDRRDYNMVGSCFTADAYLKYGTLWEGTGIARILDFVKRVERFPVTMHFMGNQSIEVHGDTAAMETYCIAHHRYAKGGEERLLVAGIRYVDQLVRRQGHWAVAHRLMYVDWERDEAALTRPA